MANLVLLALLVGVCGGRAPKGDTELPAVASMMNASAHTLGRISKHVEKIGKYRTQVGNEEQAAARQQEQEQKMAAKEAKVKEGKAKAAEKAEKARLEKKSKEAAAKERERRQKEIKAKWIKPFWDVESGFGSCTPTNGEDSPAAKASKVGVPQCALYEKEHCKVPVGKAKKIDSAQNCRWAGSRIIKGCQFKCQRIGDPPAGWVGPSNAKKADAATSMVDV